MAPDTDWHANIDRRLESIEGVLREIHGDLGALRVLSHAPGVCALAPRVLGLETTQARQGGILVMIGSAAGMVSSLLVGAALKLIGK